MNARGAVSVLFTATHSKLATNKPATVLLRTVDSAHGIFAKRCTTSARLPCRVACRSSGSEGVLVRATWRARATCGSPSISCSPPARCDMRLVTAFRPLSMLRPIRQEDRAALLSLAEATGLFTTADELDQFKEGLDASLDGSLGPDHLWTAAEQDDLIVGATYVAPDGAHYPSPHAGDGVWNMYFIGVLPQHQRQRVGSNLLQAVEAMLVERKAKTLIIETSGKDDFEKIRAFYQGHGYQAIGSTENFYSEGDDKVTYRKELATEK